MKSTRKIKKDFDCVEMKRKAQRRIYEEIKNLTPEEEIAYFDRAVREGPLAEWWSKLEKAGRKSKTSGRIAKAKSNNR